MSSDPPPRTDDTDAEIARLRQNVASAQAVLRLHWLLLQQALKEKRG
jgi:hypothetical protein